MCGFTKKQMSDMVSPNTEAANLFKNLGVPEKVCECRGNLCNVGIGTGISWIVSLALFCILKLFAY